MSPGWYRSSRRTIARSPSWRLGSMLLPVTTTYEARPPSWVGAATTQTANTSVSSAPENRSDSHRRGVGITGRGEGVGLPRHGARLTSWLIEPLRLRDHYSKLIRSGNRALRTRRVARDGNTNVGAGVPRAAGRNELDLHRGARRRCN